MIEAAPAILLSAADCAVLDRTSLAHYYFHWDGDADGDGRGALALGYVGLCNHSAQPRARVVRNYADTTLDLVALEDIAVGEEITIDYNCPLWFDVSE
jgi:SET domain-containing protein